MGIDDRRVVVRHDEAGNQTRRDRSRYREDDAVLAPQPKRVLVEQELADTAVSKTERPEAAAEADLCTTAGQERKCRINEALGQPVARQHWPAGRRAAS